MILIRSAEIRRRGVTGDDRVVDWRQDVIDRFKRDLPEMVVIWSVVTIGLVAWLASTGSSRAPEMILAMAFGLVALAPLLWVRWEWPLVRTAHHRIRRSIAVALVACLWAAAVLIALTVGLAILGIE